MQLVFRSCAKVELPSRMIRHDSMSKVKSPGVFDLNPKIQCQGRVIRPAPISGMVEESCGLVFCRPVAGTTEKLAGSPVPL